MSNASRPGLLRCRVQQSSSHCRGHEGDANSPSPHPLFEGDVSLVKVAPLRGQMRLSRWDSRCQYFAARRSNLDADTADCGIVGSQKNGCGGPGFPRRAQTCHIRKLANQGVESVAIPVSRVDNVNALLVGLRWTGAYFRRNSPSPFLQGPKSGSSPTSGTLLPHVKGIFGIALLTELQSVLLAA